jgi:nucleotide-binding universal stress UspA family protein
MLACDGGPAAAAALRWVIDHVGHDSVEVEIVDTVDPHVDDAVQRREGVRAMAKLLRLVAPAVRLTVTVADADPLELLVRSEETLVVIGAHRGDRKGTQFVKAAIARARGPVVVVPSEWICRQGPVIVGVGAEDDLTATLTFAEAEGTARRADIRMIHAWDTTGPGEIPPAWDFGTDSIPERQRQALARLAGLQQRSHPGLTVTSEAVQGQAVARLADAARDASLLVVGRSHRNAVMRAMFGSTARGLVAKLPCPVAVIP